MSKYYIARDKDRSLWVYKEKPTKKERTWATDYFSPCYKIIKNALFPDVQWEDEEPKVITIEESPWISVEERYPHFDENNPKQYFVRVKTGGIDQRIYYAVTPLTSRNHFGIEMDWTRVTHWMPIPEFKE